MYLYVGSQNDGLWIIDRPPMINTDTYPEGGNSETIRIAKIIANGPFGDQIAKQIVECWNEKYGK